MNKTLLHTIEMPHYPRRIKLSDSRRAKYFSVGDAIPKKYNQGLLSGALQYRERVKGKAGCLFDTVTKEFVIKNARVAGTERWEVINGQKIYNAGYHPVTRAKIMDEIHEFYSLFLSALTPITTFPLYIECEIHDYAIDPISRNKPFDAFNRGFPYCKAFEDVLVKYHVIPDDTTQYVVCPSHPIFFPLAHDENLVPKLIFKIYSVS